MAKSGNSAIWNLHKLCKNSWRYFSCYFSAGVQNVTALGNAISWQKADYDFGFHKAEFPTNVKFLVLSEGKSMLPVS